MIPSILRSLLPRFWGYIAAFGAAALAVLGIYSKGRADAKAKAETKAMKEDLKAHERINQADTGTGLSDDQRTQRLRGFAAKHGNGQAEGKGR